MIVHGYENAYQRATMIQQLKHGGISWDVIYIHIYIYTVYICIHPHNDWNIAKRKCDITLHNLEQWGI